MQPQSVQMTTFRSECLPQVFLRNGGSLEALKEMYAISHRRGIEFPHLVSLKYSQIDSPLGDPTVQQCRGIILDEKDNWRIVARPFDKFFNWGEPHAAKIDWGTAQVQEKLDGTLCILYWYAGDWRVATTGTPDATGEVGPGEQDITFKQLFWRTWDHLGYIKPAMRWQPWTFLFELMTPYNRVVCRYPEPRLVFLGARGAYAEGEELSPDEFAWQSYKWTAVKEFPLRTMAHIQSTFVAMDPLNQEGYVVVDSDYHRIKVKHPGYVALHHMRGDGYGPRRILEVILAGNSDEVVSNFPEWAEDFSSMTHKLAELIAHLEDAYMRLGGIPLQKAFALEAVKTRCPSALFCIRKGKFQSVQEFLRQMNPDTLLIVLQTPWTAEDSLGHFQEL